MKSIDGMGDYSTTFHRDGTVTYWNVYRQQWMKHIPAQAITAAVLATLSDDECEKIIRIAKRVAEEHEQRTPSR